MRDKNMGLKYKLPKHDFKTDGLKKEEGRWDRLRDYIGFLSTVRTVAMPIVRRRFC
jgi:hypothetical protein